MASDTPADIYERHFVPVIGRPFALPVVDSVGLQPGQRVLDVACGTGVAARLAAGRVGAAGTVVGVDGNPGMLAVAASTTTAAPDTGPVIEWREALADALPFAEAAFDAVLCSLGLQFFADQPTAVAEMHRVLAPGGRLAIGVCGPMPPLMVELHDVLAEQLGPGVAAFVRVVFALDDPATLRDLMQRGGLTEVDVDHRSVAVRLPPPADFFWQYVLGTPLALAVRDLDPDQRHDLERAVVARWQPYAKDGTMDVDVGLILGTAKGGT